MDLTLPRLTLYTNHHTLHTSFKLFIHRGQFFPLML